MGTEQDIVDALLTLNLDEFQRLAERRSLPEVKALFMKVIHLHDITRVVIWQAHEEELRVLPRD